MTRRLDFDISLFKKNIDFQDYESATNSLKSVFKLVKDEKGAPIRYEFCEEVLIFFKIFLSEIVQQDLHINLINLCKELYRSLRNYVINPDVQEYLSRDDVFLMNTKFLLVNLDNDDCLKVVWQFIINLVINNTLIYINNIAEQFVDVIFTSLEQRKSVYEATALLYNLTLRTSLEHQFSFNNYKLIMDLYQEYNNIEFLQFLLEKIISSYSNFWLYYKEFPLESRVAVLNLIRERQIADSHMKINPSAVKTISQRFAASCDIIFQTAQSEHFDLTPYEVSLLLEVLASLCDEDYLKILQDDKDLLINSGVVLINMQRLGKEENNCFTAIQRLAEIRQPGDEIRNHPAFGFKANLVRLLGNLCWKNKRMQDLAREAELIPAVLDCCNMDARNPLIMQWAILSVRNLCDANVENQRIIASLHQEGAVSSNVLKEMGLTLHSDDAGGDIKIVPLDALRNNNKHS